MKTTMRSIQLGLLTLFFTALTAVYSFAQDAGGTSTTNNESSVSVHHAESGPAAPVNNWYTAPWVWVLGGAVFILLLVALLRGGSSSSRSESK